MRVLGLLLFAMCPSSIISTTPYDDFSKEALVLLCNSRNIVATGRRDTLIQRLVHADRAAATAQRDNEVPEDEGEQEVDAATEDEQLAAHASPNYRQRRRKRQRSTRRNRRATVPYPSSLVETNPPHHRQLQQASTAESPITPSSTNNPTSSDTASAFRHLQRRLEALEQAIPSCNETRPEAPQRRRIEVGNDIETHTYIEARQATRQRPPQLPAIPEQQLEKIKKGQFVNFNLLLPQPASSMNSSQGFVLSVSEDDPGKFSISGTGDDNMKSSKGKVRVTNPQLWFLAWSLFFGAMIVFYEHLAPALVRYQERICRYFTCYPFQSVADYDVQFRRKLAVNPDQTSWDGVDLDIFSSTLRSHVQSGLQTSSSQNNQNKVYCYKCGVAGHYASRCPTVAAVPYLRNANQGSKSGAQGTQSRPKAPLTGANSQLPSPFLNRTYDANAEVCIFYNTRYCKKGDACNLLHKCSFCGKYGHPAHSCRASRSS